MLAKPDPRVRGVVIYGNDDGPAVKETAEGAPLALPERVRSLDGKSPERVIVVPNRIVNVVV
ncbi:MAG: hypothetical protein B7Y08_09710 [Rhodospirillales bacterium 24-66-33]|nr:MAG: hypothetical protein B7Y57_09900 [Rhodospirillales bacterium 35-66-84]OYZ95043.1 MAG: hypothetical protein B7Y08_09710 [Rhodospirillales bacterium 24-66-33]OZB26483.1 MAG: hypothetical protein B7X63_08065 [Rhodospirillales bacterium 39-66-50]